MRYIGLLFCWLWLTALSGYTSDRPLIGISSVYDEDHGRIHTRITYVQAVLDAGGTPVILPVIQNDQVLAHYVELLDALVLVGGRDVPPLTYGEQPHPTVVPMPDQRFQFEQSLIKAWLNQTEKPLLGICLGLQMTNVARGGSLIQDIPDQVGNQVTHRNPKGATHQVQIDQQSRLYKILGVTQAEVNSFHHQAVKRPGKGLRAIAHSPDGVIEAMELTDDNRFGLFVQWHPERIQDERHRRRLFQALIDATQAVPATQE